MSEVLTPYAFISVDELATYLDKNTSDTGESDRLTRALNGATSWMNRRAARNLKARNYRTAVSVQVTATALIGATQLTVPSAATLKAGDELLGANLAVGTIVDGISGTTVSLNRGLASAIAVAPVTITTGTAPTIIDQSFYASAREMYLPECPVLAGNIWAIYWLDAYGNRTAVDTSAIRVEEASGLILNGMDIFPFGDLKLQIEFRGGYEIPSATAVGHWNEVEELKRITRRVGEIFWQDENSKRGRSPDTTLGGFSAKAEMEMPKDIEDALRPYWRMS